MVLKGAFGTFGSFDTINVNGADNKYSAGGRIIVISTEFRAGALE